MATFFQAGKYEALRVIGQGGMGIVHEARAIETGERIAIKQIFGSDRWVFDAEKQGVEIQKAAATADPRVTRVLETWEEDGSFFVAMELVGGTPPGPTDPRTALGIARQIAEVLANLHSIGLLHCDLSFNNIRVLEDGSIKILDFGIAKRLRQNRNSTRNPFANVHFSSPEYVRTGEVSFESELWSLGILLYFMLEGKFPFEASDPSDVEKQILEHTGTLTLPRRPKPVENLVAKTLAPQIEDRFRTAQELRDAIAGVEEELTRPVDAHRTQLSRDPSHAVPASPARRPAPRAPAEGNAFPVAPWKAGAALVALIALAVFLNKEWTAWKRCRELMGQIEKQTRTDISLPAMKMLFRNISDAEKQGLLAGRLCGCKKALSTELVRRVDSTLNEWISTESPTVSRSDWVFARSLLDLALEINPRRSDWRARAIFCEGQIRRIDRQSRDAIRLFEQASVLDDDWPDPHYALAVCWIYYPPVRAGTFKNPDIERAREELEKARKDGLKRLVRHEVMLGDAYKNRGEFLFRTAPRGESRQRQLEASLSALEEASRIFERFPAFPGVNTQIEDLARLERQVTETLEEAGASR